uniref:RING-type domain-containing protein n=1 Tax=Plectus sambesii TaxID=2011161 RepID=A0A914XRJ8_9BILA
MINRIEDKTGETAEMADWTHCNICMRQPSTDVAFFLTGCGHILCKNCVDSGAADPQCKVCNQKSGVLEINRHLQPDLQEFFKDPKDLLVRYQQKLNKVFEFQSAHRKRINKYHKDLQQKATKMAQYFQNEMKKKSELERQYKMTKEQNKQLQEKITRQQEELRSYKTQMYQYQASAERHRSTQVPHYRSRSPNSTG